MITRRGFIAGLLASTAAPPLLRTVGIGYDIVYSERFDGVCIPFAPARLLNEEYVYQITGPIDLSRSFVDIYIGKLPAGQERKNDIG